MKDTKNDGLKMYTNSGLAVGSIFLTLLIIGGLLLVNYWGNGMKEVKICCVVIGGLWFVGCLFSAPKWYANIEFTQEGLIFRAPFRKTTLIPYKRIHIYPASYIHVCVEVPYIVFSTKIMSNYELTHINNGSQHQRWSSPSCTAERPNEKLLKVLPPEGRAMLRATFDGKYEQEMQQKDSQGKK